jgi:hypothetical protein
VTTNLSSNLVFVSQIPGFTNVPLPGLGIQFIDALCPFDGGPIDFQPCDGVTHSNLMDDDESSIRITDPAVLASVFTGNGNLVVQTSAADASSSSGCGNLALVFLNTTQAFLEVEYLYCTNTPPVANDDSAQVCTGGTVDIAVLENDVDPNGGIIDCNSLTVLQQPLHGTATVVSGCGAGQPCPGVCVQYVSTDPTFTGNDTFTYRITDNIGRVDTATVTVTVCATTALDDAVAICGNSVSVPVLQNDSTSCGSLDCSSLVILSQPAHGVVTIDSACTAGAPCPGTCLKYTLTDVGFGGTDSFTYGIGNLLSPACSDQATVTITICSVDAVNDSATVCAGSSIAIAVTANDTTTCGALNCASLQVLQQPLHGTVQVQGCDIVYTPAAGYSGPDSFQYVIANDQAPPCRDRATVSLSVCSTIAADDSAALCSGTSATIPVTANDSTTCGAISCATLAITSPPQHGTAQVQGCDVLYTPAAGYSGPDSFAYTVCNDQVPSCCDSGTVSLDVCATDAADDGATVCAGSSTTIAVTANDSTTCGTIACGSLGITSPPAHGTAVVQGCNVLYTPAPGYSGPDAFAYSVGGDGPLTCPDTATVLVDVCATDAVDDSGQVCAGSSVTVAVTANDTTTCGSISCATLSVTIPPQHGTALVQGCNVVYTANADYHGPDGFSYTVGNDQSPSCADTASVAIDVRLGPSIDPIPDAVRCAGESITICATVEGEPAPTLQWFKGGAPIAGQNGPCLTLGPLTEADEAVYTLVATNDCGQDKEGVTLTVDELTTTTPLAPAEACPGDTVMFSTVASGTGPFTYAWTKDGALIPGEAGDTLVIESYVPGDAGEYCVIVTGACNQVTECAPLEDRACEGAHCTLTQGAYGSAGGYFNGLGTLELLQALLAEDLVVGKLGQSSLRITLADAQCVLDRLPGGGPAATLPTGFGDGVFGADCQTVPVALPLQNGKIRNILLAQTITLGLNLRLSAGAAAGSCTPSGSSLGDREICQTMRTAGVLPGPDGCLGTADDVTDLLGPDGDPNTPDHLLTVTIPASVLQALTSLGLDWTVGGLLELANRALAGDPQLGGASLSDINSAVDAINVGFDECRVVVDCTTP